jgi:hypothetical protein
VLAVLATLHPVQVQAQTFFGSVVGTVTDATGAIIPEAKVTIINNGTNEKKMGKSDAGGNYRFMSLVPANYKIEVEKESFKRFVRPSVTVAVEASERVDVTLEVGAATETVQVTTEAPQLNTESGSLGTEVEATRVAQMPLNGRNVMNLVALVPGVIPQGSTMGTTGMNGGNGTHTTPGSWGNYQIGGGIAAQSAQYYDGVTINVIGNLTALVPTQDAVQEFRVQTNAVSPEFGRFSGGVMEMTSKSGSNQWHGSAYEYVRNKLFNANDWYSNHNGVKRQEWNQNQFGVVASGPAIKDKLFGFFSWEHFVSRLGVPGTTNTPTTEMQSGIVHNYVVDPTGNCAGITYLDASGTVVMPDATHSNVAKTQIPSSCWDATSTVMKNLYPAPNTNHLIGSGNWYAVPVIGDTQSQYNGRGDWIVNQNQRLFARYTYWTVADTPNRVFLDNGGFKSANSYTMLYEHQGVVGDTYTINPTTIVDFRLGFTRLSSLTMAESGLNVDESQFKGNWASLAPQMTYKLYPGPHLSGAYGILGLGPMTDTGADYYNNYSLAASLTKIIGQHTLKVGTEERLMVDVKHGVSGTMDPSGAFTFDRSLVGDEWAAFLLGEFTTGTIHTASPRAAFVWPQGYYVNDSWMASKKLTINAGLRWDLPSSLAERQNKATVLLPNGTATDAKGNIVNGTLALVNNSLSGNNAYTSRTIQQTKYDEFEPRVGFAYRLTNDTVVRGGYGLVFVPPDLNTSSSPNGSIVNAAGNTASNALNASKVLVNPIYYANAFTSINQPQGRNNAAFMAPYVNAKQTIAGANPNEPYGYNQQWNLTVGQQFTHDLSLEAGYVGAHGTHLPESGNWGINQWDWTKHNQETNLLSNAACASDNNLVMTVAQCERSFPAYKDVQNTNHNNGSSSYHSLQAKVEKRFQNSGVISVGYLWSKFISNTDTLGGGSDPHGTKGGTGGNGAAQDYNNPQGERSILSFNVPQRLVVSYVLNLPFGKGEKFGANTNPEVRGAISGWSVNGITTFQSGTPAYLSVNGGNYMTQNLGGGTLRPNYIAGCNKNVSGSRFQKAQTGALWFNTACFYVPGTDPTTGNKLSTYGYVYGNEPRVDGGIRSQGSDNFDFTAAKTTTVYENMNLQFRAEFFNIFNHPQFQPPSWQVGNSFGQTLMQQNQQRLIQLSLRLNY